MARPALSSGTATQPIGRAGLKASRTLEKLNGACGIGQRLRAVVGWRTRLRRLEMLGPRASICAVAIAVSVILAASGAQAQGLSDRPITIVVPYTAGTGIDIVARTIGEELRERWNQ